MNIISRCVDNLLDNFDNNYIISFYKRDRELFLKNWVKRNKRDYII